MSHGCRKGGGSKFRFCSAEDSLGWKSHSVGQSEGIRMGKEMRVEGICRVKALRGYELRWPHEE